MSICLKDFGVVCSLGNDKKEVFQYLISEKKKNFLTLNDKLPLDEPQYVGQVNIPDIDKLSAINTHNNKLAYLAYKQIEDVLLPLKAKYGASRIAVIIGTSTASIYEGELARKEYEKSGSFPEQYHYEVQEMSAPANYIAEISGAKGPVYGISTACTSSGKTLISAKALLDSGLADVVIAGGVDSLTQLTVNGFKSLESTSKSICRPFNEARDGINIGEAAALFIITKESGGIQLLGAGETSDAYHISAPSPDGDGAFQAMSLALKNSGISGDQIDYVNLHGTGTIKNDQMEAIAMQNSCGPNVPCGSTKSLTGHTLGAAGALEVGLCWLLLSDYNTEQKLPMSCSFESIDDSLSKINLSYSQPLEKITYCMSNSFAFGGNNFSAVIGRNHE